MGVPEGGGQAGDWPCQVQGSCLELFKSGYSGLTHHTGECKKLSGVFSDKQNQKKRGPAEIRMERDRRKTWKRSFRFL